VSDEGVLLLAADHVLTADLIARLRSLEKRLDRELVFSIKPESTTAGSDPGPRGNQR
jgi:hypothetical protein